MRPETATDKSEVDPEDVAGLIQEKPSYIDAERAETSWPIHVDPSAEEEGKLVDVSARFYSPFSGNNWMAYDSNTDIQHR